MKARSSDVSLEGKKMDKTLEEKEDLKFRTKIAQTLTSRCNNCYHKLPGYNVHGLGWNWLTGNIGPYCNDCWKEILEAISNWKKK